jgi:hypothetical protein
MDEDLDRMPREQLIDEIKKLRQGVRAGPCGAGLAAVPARLPEVSPVA